MKSFVDKLQARDFSSTSLDCMVLRHYNDDGKLDCLVVFHVDDALMTWAPTFDIQSFREAFEWGS